MIFPRYHQLQAVRLLVDAARSEGVGQNYLIRPLAKINYGTVGGFKNLRSISIRHPNEVTKVLCIDYDMDFL
ncbi:hypothetical protein [Nostoc sp.]|uniref:hypothetical protein n=1 Tax=Nostoc sp. TaxID=1180 RepID=UPI002FFC6C5F